VRGELGDTCLPSAWPRPEPRTCLCRPRYHLVSVAIAEGTGAAGGGVWTPADQTPVRPLCSVRRDVYDLADHGIPSRAVRASISSSRRVRFLLTMVIASRQSASFQNCPRQFSSSSFRMRRFDIRHPSRDALLASLDSRSGNPSQPDSSLGLNLSGVSFSGFGSLGVKHCGRILNLASRIHVLKA